jgi:hypothetical protein
MSTYENEGIPRNGGGIGLDSLSCLRPQELMWATLCSCVLYMPQTSDCIFQKEWNIIVFKELYIQNTAKYRWSQGDIWHVPPLPGPSHG